MSPIVAGIHPATKQDFFNSPFSLWYAPYMPADAGLKNGETPQLIILTKILSKKTIAFCRKKDYNKFGRIIRQNDQKLDRDHEPIPLSLS